MASTHEQCFGVNAFELERVVLSLELEDLALLGGELGGLAGNLVREARAVVLELGELRALSNDEARQLHDLALVGVGVGAVGGGGGVSALEREQRRVLRVQLELERAAARAQRRQPRMVQIELGFQLEKRVVHR